MQKTDIDLQRDVVAELECDPSVDASRIGVTVRDGVVVLNGSVPTFAEKSAAEDAVKRVAGVRALAVEVHVEPPAHHQRDDADIAADAADALSRDVFVLPSHVNVRVEGGRVTLSGEVKWNFQREAAVKAVAHLPGVREVYNLVKLAPRPTVDPKEVQRHIRTGLHRWAQDESNRIRIDVSDGKVTLRGYTDSWVEREQAARAAWGTPGVAQVENLIVVDA